MDYTHPSSLAYPDPALETCVEVFHNYETQHAPHLLSPHDVAVEIEHDLALASKRISEAVDLGVRAP